MEAEMKTEKVKVCNKCQRTNHSRTRRSIGEQRTMFGFPLIISSFQLALIFIFLPQIELIHLKDFGVHPLNKDDIALAFYATVENTDDIPFTVGLKMEECCQYFKDREVDCKSMALHSDLDLDLFPKDIRNLTLYYTNLYLHGRNGSCSIMVRWRFLDAKNNEPLTRQQFDVPFNTLLSEPNFLLQYWQEDDPDIYSQCSSIDEDPKNHCMPVNCLIKYSGYRSFYNQTAKLCQKTPVCTDIKGLSSDAENRPSVVLSPISNKCINLWAPRTFTESMQSLTQTIRTRVKDYKTYPIKTVCANGEINSDKICECKEGWTSQDFPSKTFNPSYDVYSMCDVEITENSELRVNHASTSLFLLLIFVFTALIFACLCFPILWGKYRHRKYDRMSEESPAETSEYPSYAHLNPRPAENRSIVLPPPTHYPTRPEMLPEYQEDENGYIVKRSASKTGDEQLRGINFSPSNETIARKTPSTTSSGPNNYVISSQRKSPLNSKKLFFPQLSKSANFLPAPLTPIIEESETKVKNNSARINSGKNRQSLTTPAKEWEVTTEKQSPSIIKLKCILNEIELCTKEMAVETDEVTDGISDPSLERPSESNLESSSKEFWECVSDSDGNETFYESQTQEKSKYGFWVDKFKMQVESI